MSVAIIAHQYVQWVPVVVTTDEALEACYEAGIYKAYADEAFTASLRGLKPGDWYLCSGETLHLDYSYSGYNSWREQLCQAALGVEPHEVWYNPAKYRDRPFFELIHFSDCEGTIGPEACADLFADFEADWDDLETVVEGYSMWAAQFSLAADTGMVRFT